MKKLAIALTITLLGAAAAQADLVEVRARGTVLFNGITTPPLNAVAAGQLTQMVFTVDSGNFVEGVPGDTRGYVIDQPSFHLMFSGGVNIGLLNPFPAGQTPYFALVDGFPVSDGFFVSTSALSPGGVPLSQTPIQANLDLGYVGTTLGSLDILAAIGTYGFTGLTRFSFNLWRVVPDNVVMDIDFTDLTLVTPLPVEPSTWGEVKAHFQ
jgi:hypothetical protein